ncbi:MAG: UbiA family prenyltransferase [FCB group bacterium]|nr:UbiA family prenyltransferase [FCB group bacterium]
MERFRAHIKLLRPLNLVTGAFAVFVSAAILGKAHQAGTLLFTVLVVVCYNAAANAINDYFDYEVDLINRPSRPLSRGLVKRDTALFMSVFLFVAGSGFAFMLPPLARLLALGIALPLMIVYSWKLKGLPLIGNVVVSFILGLTFVFSGAAFAEVRPLVVPALLAFGLTLVRELVKDIADYEGDRKAGLRTFPLVAGLKQAIILSIVLTFMIGFGAIVPYWLQYYGQGYLLVLILGVEIPLLYIVYKFVRFPDDATAKTAARILKLSTIAGVVAVYLG